MRADSDLINVPVILVADKDSKTAQDRLLSPPAVRLINKPFSLTNLRELVVAELYVSLAVAARRAGVLQALF
jgi:hypothetical protein